MKRKPSFITYLVACVLLLPMLSGMSAPVSGWIDYPKGAFSIKSVLSYHDELWLYTGDRLYVLNAQTGEIVPLPEGMNPQKRFDALMSDTGQLWGLDAAEGNLYSLSEEDGTLLFEEKALTLDIGSLLEDASDAGESYQQAWPRQAMIDEFRLYLLYESTEFMGEGESGMALLSFDLRTGKGKWYQIPFITAISTYKGGKLLAACYEPNANDTAGSVMRVIDPENGEEGEMMTLSFEEEESGRIANLSYSEEEDLVYFTIGEKLYSPDSEGRAKLCAYVDYLASVVSGQLTPLSGRKALLVTEKQLLLTSTNPELLPKGKVRIYWISTDDYPISQTARDLRGLPIGLLRPVYLSTADLSQLLLLREDHTEVLTMDTEAINIEAVKSKGYFYDLSESKILKSYVNSLYSELKALATQDGKIAMIPYERDDLGGSYNPAVFEALGLDTPETFDELCDLIDRWNDELVYEHPDYLLIDPYNLNAELAVLAISIHAAYCEGSGEAFSFTSPVLRQMLERAAAVRYDSIEPIDFRYDTWLEVEHTLIGRLNSASSSIAYEMGLRPLVLTAKEGDRPMVASQIRLMMVNPFAEYPEEAVRFLETFIGHIRNENLLRLTTTITEPVIREGFEESWANSMAYYEERKIQETKLEGAEKREMESKNEYFRKNLDRTCKYERFDISPDMLESYPRLVANSFIKHAGDPASFVRENGELLNRYLDGQIDIDAFLREADQKLRLKTLEDN